MTEFECAEIIGTDDAVRFMTAGNATFTLRSRKTQTRFTYRIRESEDGSMLFVAVLTGPDNEASYEYIGHMKRHNLIFFHGRKAKISADAPSVKAFDWSWRQLVAGKSPADLAIFHEGRCGRCGRKLTVPESIMSGFGPECEGRMRLTSPPTG